MRSSCAAAAWNTSTSICSHLGFSAHGALPVIRKFLDAVGEHMEFGQLQLNYLDWDFQQARDKAAELNRRNIPIWVMEPLRGGRLARLTDEEAEKLRALRPGESPVGWAFRFLQGVPGVTVILSGMSNQEQLEANLDTFETDKPLTDAERSALLDIAGGMVNGQVLPCTACRYCVDHCPKGLDIIAPMAVGALPEDKRPSACIGCRSCERVCPQQLKISEAMADFTKKLG